jgi:hypothetical protein
LFSELSARLKLAWESQLHCTLTVVGLVPLTGYRSDRAYAAALVFTKSQPIFRWLQ